MSSPVIWNGTPAEAAALQAAVARNCECEKEGHRCRLCEAVSTDQNLLDHLVFAVRLKDRLEAQEFAVPDPPPTLGGTF